LQRQDRFTSAERVIRAGFWINAALMLVKLSCGYFGGSEAVFADGVESASDFIAISSTMIALRIGRRPLDGTHPYGHGRAESISAIVVSLIILLAVLTIVVKECLYRFSQRVGARLESPAVLAIAKDHRKDALTSVATLVGVVGAYFGIGIMDPLAAALTSIFIFVIAYQTFQGAAHDLMDGRPPEKLIGEIRALAEQYEGVEHVHDIRARRSGQFLIVDLKLDMDPDMTVRKSHHISTQVKKGIFRMFPNVGEVMIHINPHDEKHTDLTRL